MVKNLSSLDWVKLARSTDKNRPKLSQLNVSVQDPAKLVKGLSADLLIYAATDSLRLHVAAMAEPDAVFGVGDWDLSVPTKALDDNYPNWRQVVPAGDPNYRIKHQIDESLVDVLVGAIAAVKSHGRADLHPYNVWIRLGEDKVLSLVASQLLDALKGIEDPAITITDANSPIKLIGRNRLAVIMPKRSPSTPNPRWEISRFFEQVP